VLNLTKLESGRWCFVVVIQRSKSLLCNLGPNFLKFQTERNALAVAVICTNGRKYRSVKDYYWAGIFF
jgi:hypothetical protein